MAGPGRGVAGWGLLPAKLSTAADGRENWISRMLGRGPDRPPMWRTDLSDSEAQPKAQPGSSSNAYFQWLRVPICFRGAPITGPLVHKWVITLENRPEAGGSDQVHRARRARRAHRAGQGGAYPLRIGPGREPPLERERERRIGSVTMRECDSDILVLPKRCVIFKTT